VAQAESRLDRISAGAHDLKFGRALGNIAIAPFYVIGWILGKAWLVVSFIISAIRIGWKEAS